MQDYDNATYAVKGIGGLVGGSIGYVGTTAVPDTKPTFMDPLGSAHGNLNELVGRLEIVTQRLCGASPPEPQQTELSSKLQSVPNGVFDELTARGHDMNRKLSRAHDLIGRIERALP